MSDRSDVSSGGMFGSKEADKRQNPAEVITITLDRLEREVNSQSRGIVLCRGEFVSSVIRYRMTSKIKISSVFHLDLCIIMMYKIF